LGLVTLDQFDLINRNITLLLLIVITLSTFLIVPYAFTSQKNIIQAANINQIFIKGSEESSESFGSFSSVSGYVSFSSSPEPESAMNGDSEAKCDSKNEKYATNGDLKSDENTTNEGFAKDQNASNCDENATNVSTSNLSFVSVASKLSNDVEEERKLTKREMKKQVQ
jgi:hypothetical protein